MRKFQSRLQTVLWCQRGALLDSRWQRMFLLASAIAWIVLRGNTASCEGDHPLAAPGVTSLTNQAVEYRVPKVHHVTLVRGEVTAMIVDNAAVDLPELPGHRAGYNGVASLKHARREQNLFVPIVGGLNFEHIHDGTREGLVEKFEPRKFPMQLRQVAEYIVEVYQPATGNWGLESCGRYELLSDGTIEYTFECIPRQGGYRKGYIGLFWASYIHQPEEKAIHFVGRAAGSQEKSKWIRAVTPQHGVDSTHPPAGYPFSISVDEDFPLTLVGHPSSYEHTAAWYYGVSHGMAAAMMFRPGDQIWLAQSPSGGGQGNPAWDFQWFIPNYKIDEAYGFKMRMAYVPFENHEQVVAATRAHRAALADDKGQPGEPSVD